MLLRELAASLERAQNALVGSDPGQLRLETTRQQGLCNELRRFYARSVIGEAHRDSTAESDRRSSERLLGFAREISRVEGEVLRLNAVYGELLKKSRRTVDIFCRILAYSGTTYNLETQKLEPQLKE